MSPIAEGTMTMNSIAEVEVKRWHGEPEQRIFGWQRMPVKQALQLQDETFRCPECLGKLRLYPASSEKDTPGYAKHLSKNTGCSLGDCFDGQKRPHPKPVD